MKTLLERAFNHLTNGDEDKAIALIHKFMVERARQIHEALRESDGDIDELDENWGDEIREEEYFGDDDLAGDDPDSSMDGNDPNMMGDDTDAGADTDTDAVDDMGGDDTDAIGGDDTGDEFDDDEFGDDQPADGLEGKIDDLTGKIDELTAEFDRVMAEFHDDDGTGDEFGDDDDFADDGTADDVLDSMDADTADEDDDNLAGRMEDDMGDDMPDDDDAMAEGEMPDFLKKGKDDLDEDDDVTDPNMDDDELSDITESVLAELDRISPPGNTEHRGVGANTAKNNITSGSNKSALTHHNVMDRVNQAKPVMTKGPSHKGYARETAPTVADPNTLVKNVRKGNRRTSSTDTTSHVSHDGDGAALLNKDFAGGGPKPTRSTIDGKTKKG